jgi:acyl-CoA synthetase (AMP-forming)/AMP-acid ligase II
MLRSIMNIPGAGDPSYEQLRIISYGAAPMPPALLRAAMAMFRCDFANSFGAGTENGAVAWLTPEDHRRAVAGEDHLLGSVGRPSVVVEIRICDENIQDVPPGTVGEIVTRNNTAMSGYLAMPERSAQSMPGDGWFRAGDLGYMDGEGYLYLAGRANDMIIRGGENIYPLEIEHVMTEHPGVSEACVVGAEDEHWGQIVRAWVVAASGENVTADELAEHCERHLGRYKVPAEYWFVPELPRNASGKILKREVMKWRPRSSGGSTGYVAGLVERIAGE